MVAAKANSTHSSTQAASKNLHKKSPPKTHLLHPSIATTIPSSINTQSTTIDSQQHTAVDPESIAQAAIRAATEAAASVTLKEEDHAAVSILDQSSEPLSSNHIPGNRAHQQIHTNPLSNAPSLDTTELLNVPNHAAAFPQKMDIHDATGTILHQLGVNGEPDAVQQPPQQPEHAPQNQQVIQNQHSNQQTPQDHSQVTAAEASQQPQQAQQAPVASQQQPPSSVLKPVAQTAPTAISPPINAPRKPARMPGTKQCPSCQNTIAAALAKCPKCPHVFREKKEKVKRSGKRGKKNCPKCTFENPSACSSCKNCKYVFRLKLMDKYKQMRPRPTSETAAAAAAAAAHAAANMPGQHAGVTAVSTVPMQAGVASYPNPVAQPGHPAHAAVSVMPPLGQHPISMHPHAHNVHATGVPQMHPLPHNTMPHHQTHPQL